jgi:hypothetical protein
MDHLVALYSYGEYDLNLTRVNKHAIKMYSIDEIELFIADSSAIKIAAIEMNYLYPDLTDIELEKIKNCDMVVVKSMELTSVIVDLMTKYDRGNFVFVINGFLSTELSRATVKNEMSWITSTANIYQSSLLDITNNNLFPFKEKSRMFDVMYGTPKEHRVFVKNKLQDHVHSHWFYESPFFVKEKDQTWSNLNFNNSDLWEDNIDIDQADPYKCKYHGHDMLISQVMPFKIYNKTAYSLVFETSASNNFSFFTEKIVKPILAHRLFITVSGQYYLKNLKKLGFQTFDNIINESYDSEPDNHRRWSMAIEQALLLCQRPQQEILSQIVPIVFHNYQILKNLNSNNVNDQIEMYLIQQGLYKL